MTTAKTESIFQSKSKTCTAGYVYGMQLNWQINNQQPLRIHTLLST